MTNLLNVAALVGSLRRESYTRRLTEALVRLAPPSMRIGIVPIGGLPLYNQDDEPAPPRAWVEFREHIKRSDAVLFATPEYNRSMSGCLKNAIDVGSRPWGHSAWAGRPAAVISCSPGNLGGFGAHHHLRQSLVAVNMPTMAHPEAYIAGSDQLFSVDGEFANPATRDFCVHFLKAFETWIHRNGVKS
jgi:chromate reductase, NAD(P)H dehydrogenase (quinone)